MRVWSWLALHWKKLRFAIKVALVCAAAVGIVLGAIGVYENPRGEDPDEEAII